MEFIDLCTPPPSPVQRTYVAGKRKATGPPETVSLLSDSDDDEVCEVVPPARLSYGSASGGGPSGGGPGPADDDGDDDLVFVGRTGDNALEDFPHARENCVVAPFSEDPKRHCANCFCYCCDVPATECAEWASHCTATHTQAKWRAVRKERQQRPSPAAPPAAAPSPCGVHRRAGGVPKWCCERVLREVQQVWPVETPEPAGLLAGTKLKPYQKQCLAFMLHLERAPPPLGTLHGAQTPSTVGRRTDAPSLGEVRGGWLASEVGMGKTMVAISLVLANPAAFQAPQFGVKKKHQATLVLAPGSLLGQWADEIEKFAPTLKVFNYHQSKNLRTATDAADADIILSTPGSVPDLEQTVHRLIVDESHALPALDSKTAAKLLHRVKAHNVLLLTGTPLTASVDELKLGAMLLGQAGGGLNLFQAPRSHQWSVNARCHSKWKINPDSRWNTTKCDAALVAKLRQLMIRHTKSQRIGGEVALALPEADTATVWLDMGADEKRVHDEAYLVDSLRMASVLHSGAKGMYLEMATTKRRVACAATGQRDRQDPTCFVRPCLLGTKLRALRDDLLALRAQDASMRAVVFTHVAVSHSHIVEVLGTAGFEVYSFTGSTDVKRRHALIRQFQDETEGAGAAKVFVAMVKVGSVGITLTAATRVYLMEPCFDPAQEVQAAGRIHRLGQTKDVHIKRFVFRDSLEANIVALHEAILRPQSEAARVKVVDGKIPAKGVRLLNA